jgi:hypothetical protein
MSSALTDYRILAAFTVRYKINGKVFILQPGQLLPVWSIPHWGRIGCEFELCTLTITADSRGEFVSLPGHQHISRDRFIAAQRSKTPDVEEARILDAAKLSALGGNSRFSISRPHRLPIGVGVFREPISTHDRRMQWEHTKVTFAKAIGPVEKLRHQSEALLPLPRLFVDSDQGRSRGRDVMAGGKVVKLQETMLPVCPVPHGDQFGDAMDFSSAAFDHLERLGGQTVYIGFGIYPDINTTEAVPSEQIDIDRHRASFTDASIMYTLPHGPADDHNLYLRTEMDTRTDALMTGKDELDERTIPLPEFVAGMPEQVPPTGWRVVDDLHEAGLA